MYINHEALLTAIRGAVLQKNLLAIAQEQSRPQGYRHTPAPFELYQYEDAPEGLDVQALEKEIQEEIMLRLNRELYEEECSRLKMELFALEEAVQIEDNQIAILKMQIEAERANAKMSQLTRQAQLQQEQQYLSQIMNQPLPVKPVQPMPNCAGLKDNSQFAIYPCFRVDVDPPKKTVPVLSLPAHEEREHHKSHRQLLATYTKRSLASSQENPQNHHQNLHSHHEGIEKTIKVPSPSPKEENLNGLARQISFLQRAWQKSTSDGSKKECKKYKKELMTLIGAFWHSTN